MILKSRRKISITFSLGGDGRVAIARSGFRAVLRCVLALPFVFGLQNGPALSQPVAPLHTKGRYTGLPLPRFASVRSDPVNLRVGPGVCYPIKWVLHRRGMPVEIVQEFNLWRAVRLFHGTNGWIHGALLSGHRTFVVDGATCSLWERATRDASQVARLESGVIGRILTCMKDSYWCKVSVGGYRGYLLRSEFWGTFKGEAVSGR
jgi:SH3-like domain-containing protein